MSNNQTPEIEDDWRFEDLRRLGTQIRLALIHIWAIVAWQFRKNRVLLLLSAAIVSGWAVFRVKTHIPLFESKASFVYLELHKKTYGEMLDQLTATVQEKAYGQLAKSLNITEGQAGKIMSIEALNMYGSKLSEDITTDKSPFYISIKALDKRAFDSLALKLSDYLNDNPYYQATIKRKQAKLIEEVAQLRHELQLLDSFKYRYLRSNMAITHMVAPGTAFDPVALFDKSIDVHRSIVEKEDAIQNTASVALLNGFRVPERPTFLHKTTLFVKALLLFVIAMVAILFYSIVFQKYENVSKE